MNGVAHSVRILMRTILPTAAIERKQIVEDTLELSSCAQAMGT
jgi:hypothetical protein